jgi:hypothetical protein
MTLPDGPPVAGRPPLYQRHPLLAAVVRQWALFAVIVAVGAGLALVAVDLWRSGLIVMGLALLGAALLRLLLPLPRLGFLAVRSRPVDVTLTAVAGAGLMIIALTLSFG